MNNFLIYLLQVAACQAAFYLLYHFILAKQPFFQANRSYLLLSTLASFVIPILSVEVWGSSTGPNPFEFPTPLTSIGHTSIQADMRYVNTFDWAVVFVTIAIVVYIVGVAVRCMKVFTSFQQLIRLIKETKPIRLYSQQIFRIENGPSLFSFWKYIFINEQKLNLSDKELQQVLAHEKVHIDQRHTYDVLLMEIASILCWFSPFMHQAKNALCQIHEFIADKEVLLSHANIHDYSRLMLRLAAGNNTIPLTHQFSKINLKNRITMLNQSNTNKMKALNYLFVMPLLALLLLVFSFTEKVPDTLESQTSTLQGEELVIGTINWEGNTKYSDAYLNEILGLKPGSAYQKEMVDNLLNYNPEKNTVSDLYMDHGYLYFSINLKDTIINKKVNLTFEVYEGITATVDQIIIKGNEKVATQKILDMMEIKKGDLFNRAKLIASQKNIAKSGYFDEGNVNIYPIPHDDLKLVDFEFTVHEIKRN